MKLLRLVRTFQTTRKLSWTFWQSRRLFKIKIKYFESCKTLNNLPNFRKVFLTSWQSGNFLAKLNNSFSSVSHEIGLFHMILQQYYCYLPHGTTHYHMRLLCPMWDCCPTQLLCPTQYHFGPRKNPLSHKILLCPTWHCSVFYDTALSHMTMLCPTKLFFVLNETAMSHMRLFFPISDCTLFHIRRFCPAKYFFLPHETCLSHMILLCSIWDYHMRLLSPTLDCSSPY